MALRDLTTEGGLRAALADLSGRLDQEVAARVVLQSELPTAQKSAADAAFAATASSPATPKPRSGTVDTRVLGKPEKFDGEETKWKEWRFATRAYLAAAVEGVEPGLTIDENSTQSVLNANMSQDEARMSCQLHFALVLLCTGRALDKAQGAGASEGFQAWRHLHTYWEPKSKPRLIGMLLGTFATQFGSVGGGDTIVTVGSWERGIREFQLQSSFVIPGFALGGLFVMHMEDMMLREHLMMHSGRLGTYEKLRTVVREVTMSQHQIAAAVQAASGHAPMEIGALHSKKGGRKGDGRRHNDTGESHGDKDKNKLERDKQCECFYCKKKGHIKGGLP